MTDLIVVVADQDCEEAMKGLLERPEALKIRRITYKIMRNVLRDPGCRTDIVSILRPNIGLYKYAIVIFDHEGSGAETQPREELEQTLENEIHSNGWSNNVAVIVIAPELEAWVWSDSSNVDKALGWEGRHPEVRSWIKNNTEYWNNGELKPRRPKEAMRKALREVRKPISASLFKQIAEHVSVNRCSDPSFDKLKKTLSKWFGEEA